MTRGFPFPAPWEHCNELTARSQSVFPKKLGFFERRANQTRQRMPDVLRRQAAVAEKRLFKWKNAKQAVYGAAHPGDPPFTPGPGLRRYKVNHCYALPFEPARQAQMKVGRIGEDGELGP